MKILLKTLQTYCQSLPTDSHKLRYLLDDIGIEVKNIVEKSEGTVATVELLANRGDHHSYLGIAREISGRMMTPLIPPLFAEIEKGELPIQVSIQTDKCFLYSLSEFEVDQSRTLSNEILMPLNASESSTGIPVVDLANFVGLELGQPLHVFDADKIHGNIVVRLSRPGEEAHLLFTDAPQVIPENTIVICDDKNILALAGIMGCVAAEVTANTKRVALESALFDPVSIRVQARKLKLVTQASTRFERGGDPEMVLLGAARMKYLLQQALSGKQIGQTVYVEEKGLTLPVIEVTYTEICDYFAMPIEREEIRRRLEAYGFKVEQRTEDHDTIFMVQVPSYRLWDVQTKQCLYEELAKSIGYNELPTEMPANCLGSLLPVTYRRQRQIADMLIQAGFYEVILDGFYGYSDLALLEDDQSAPLYQHVKIINSIDKAFSLLKNNGLLQALEMAAHNQRYGVQNQKVFEFTRLYLPTNDPKKHCDEKPILWGLVTGFEEKNWNSAPAALDSWYIKGLMENMLRALDVSYRIEIGQSKAAISPKLHPHRQASIYVNDVCVGIFGEVHPRYVDKFELKKQRPVYFELSGELFEAQSVSETFKEPSEWLPIKRSLAFHVPEGIETQRIIDVIKSSAPDWLQSVKVTDLFAAKKEAETIRAFTFEVVFENNNQRSAQEINQILEQVRVKVLEQFANEGVMGR